MRALPARPARSLVVVVSLVASMGLSCSSEGNERPPYDSGIQPRVFDPPPSRVRAVPPHHVHARGIGPYELGASLKDILNTLPHGPRIELFRLGPLADFSLAKSENGGLLVGIEREVGVTFVAALAEKIVRTEAGVGVGSPVAAAIKELGPTILSATVASDPRLRRHRDLPGVVFLSGHSSRRAPRVEAIVVDRVFESPAVAKKGASASDEGAPAAASKPCEIDDALRGQARDAARLGNTAGVAFLCDGGVVAGAVAYAGRRLSWLSLEKGRDEAESDKTKDKTKDKPAGGKTRGSAGKSEEPRETVRFRRLGSATAMNLVFAAPILMPEGSGVHVAAITVERTTRELRQSLQVWRVEGSRLVSVASNRIYSLSKDEITWVGGTLAGVDVAVEIEALGPTDLEVRGLYFEESDDDISMVAPLAPQSFSLKRKVPTTRRGELDAGPTSEDASADDATDAGL